MNFKHVAQMFEQLEKEPSRTQMTKLLAELFADANAREIGIICNLSLGLLRPPYQGTQFNIAEKSLIKVTADLLNVSIAEVTADTKKMGDLGNVVAEFGTMKPRSLVSVEEVYKDLCTIEEIGGEGSQELIWIF